MTVAAQIEAAVRQASDARHQGDGDGCIAHLQRAHQMVGDLPDLLAAWDETTGDTPGSDRVLAATVRWLLAKAYHDFGAEPSAIASALEVLEPLQPPLLAAQPRAMTALGQLTEKATKELGYGSPVLRRLWQALSEELRGMGEPYLAGWAQLSMGWDWACSGEVDKLAAWQLAWGNQLPGKFGDGPHRHPQAPDTPSSLYWLQMDVARTCLRAATWVGDETLAADARELYLDACADADLLQRPSFWMLETIARAERIFGWHPEFLERYQRALGSLDHDRAPLHQALGRAWFDDDPSALSAQLPLAYDAGPEWALEVLFALGRAGDDAAVARADALRQSHRVHAFKGW